MHGNRVPIRCSASYTAHAAFRVANLLIPVLYVAENFVLACISLYFFASDCDVSPTCFCLQVRTCLTPFSQEARTDTMAYSAASSSSAVSPSAPAPAKDEKQAPAAKLKPKPLPPVPFRQLFRFADGWDKLFLIVGGIFSAAAGVSESASALLMRKMLRSASVPANQRSSPPLPCSPCLQNTCSHAHVHVHICGSP